VTETDLFVALALLLAGVAIGILVMICLGIRRDDQPGGFPAHTDDPAARAARWVIGVTTRDMELTDEDSRRRDVLPV
jgi:hypothetical protein